MLEVCAFRGYFVRQRLRVAPAAAFLLLLAGSGSARAQEPPARPPEASRIEDRLSEEERIRERREWFFSTRRAGSGSAAELPALRLAGVRATRAALERQRLLRREGRAPQGNFWVSKGPSPSSFGGWSFGNVSGRVASIAADWAGGTLYVGTASGGVWKSTNEGLSWTQLFDSAGTLTVGSLAVDPNDPAVLWVGTGENNAGCETYFGIGLLRSGDGGATWESRNGSGVDSLDKLDSFANVVIDPRDSNHIVTGGRVGQCDTGSGTSGGLYTSTNGGATWTRRLTSSVYEIAQDPAVLDVYWAASGAGLYKSTDNGLTWIQQTASGLPFGNTGRTELAVAPSNGNVVYALFEAGPTLWRTVDGGVSWSQMASGSNACDGQCSYNMVLRVHPTNADVVYRGTVHVFKSQNGGANWTDLSNNWGPSQKVHQDTHHLLLNPSSPETLYVGCDGGIWKSANGGSSFTNLNGNLNLTQFYAVGVEADDPETICGGAQDNSSLVRTTSDTWALQTVTGDGFVCHFNPQNANYVYITSYPSNGFPNVWRSTSGAFGPFSDISGSGSGVINGDRANWVTPYVLDPVQPSTLYLGTHRVYRSDNHGASWVQVGPSDLTGGSGSLLSLEVNRSFPSYVYSGSTSGRVWRSTNGGAIWTDITSGLPARSINDIAADPSDPDRVFAVVGGFNTAHLWEWNAGLGWTPRPAGLPNAPANTVLLLSETELLVGTDTGIFRSQDGGQDFEPYMDGLPEGLVVTDLKYNVLQGRVTAGTYGRGAWQITAGPAHPIVLYDSIEQPLVEQDGDGDAEVEPGETWSVRVILRNVGGEPALGVQARLATSTPGITLLEPQTVGYGDIPLGVGAAGAQPYRFVVDPAFDCGAVIAWDVVDVSSTNAPNAYGSRLAAFATLVQDGIGPPVAATPFDDAFDPAPAAGWTHVAQGGVDPCLTFPYFDEWKLVTKDAAHGMSFNNGNGPGGTYGTRDHAWLHYGGKDSTNGPGIDLPADAVGASLTVVHWYATTAGEDGGQVLLDGNENNQDVYTTLVPVGGYPAGLLASGRCNVLEGKPAFQGASGGWVTSTFNLLPYKGQRVYPAFVFASDTRPGTGEGWYIDRVTVQLELEGPPVCQVVDWPASVPATSTFGRVAPGTIEARWDPSCNGAALPGQAYSIQAGDLDALRASGSYTHAPLGGDCARSSPSTFAPGPGNEYYLVLPNEGDREGGGGSDSNGVGRPPASAVCGEPREAVCP